MPGFELIGQEEREAVNRVFDRGGCLFRHSFEFMRHDSYQVVEFERRFAQTVGAARALAVTSGTAAIFAVNKALGIGPGDEVITQSFTFAATVEAILETGALPVITEVDQTLNMDPADLEAKITERTKAIWVVHMLGGPARMDEILEIGRRRGVPVLEDAAQGLGARHRNLWCGLRGLAGTFSFDFGKTLTCGEGGMIVTADADLHQAVREYCDHGHQDNPALPRGEDSARRSGFNFRMMELQGAVGLAQLAKLPGALERMQGNYRRLRDALADIDGLEFRAEADQGRDAGDALIFFLPDKAKRRRLTDSLQEAGVGFKLLPGALKWHFAGHWDHIWKNLAGFPAGDPLEMWPRSRDLLDRAAALPIMIKMTPEQIDRTAQAVRQGMAGL